MLLPKDIPQKLASFVQFSPILRWCATSCVDVWNRPWRWFGTWWPLRILEANAFHGDGQKCKQNGHKLIWPKNTAEIMSECNLCESWFFFIDTLSCWCRLLTVGNVFWLPGNHLLHSPRNQDTRKEDQNLFVPKDLQLFLRMFGEMGNSPNFRGFKKFLPTPTLSQKTILFPLLFMLVFLPKASRMAYINTSHPDFLQAGTIPGKFWARILSQVFQKMGSLEGCSWWIFGRKDQQIKLL